MLNYEWEFKVPSEEVDLERICREVEDVPRGTAWSYMQNLVTKAPIVYGRLKKYCKVNNKLNWYSWYESMETTIKKEKNA